jgi:hypothetical protein
MAISVNLNRCIACGRQLFRDSKVRIVWPRDFLRNETLKSFAAWVQVAVILMNVRLRTPTLLDVAGFSIAVRD